MTLDEFLAENLGKKIDFDNYAGAQCVDLARKYWQDVYGIPEHTGPCATTGGAKDLYKDYEKMPLEKKYLKKVKTPMQGDTVVWDRIGDSSKYGHVAIVVSVFKKWLLVAEQDGFKQDGVKFAYRTRDYVLGYLRKR